MALNVATAGTVGTCSSGALGAFSASRASASQFYQPQGVQFRKSSRDGACVCEASDSKEAVAGDVPSVLSGLVILNFSLVFALQIFSEKRCNAEMLRRENLSLWLIFSGSVEKMLILVFNLVGICNVC